jgi:tetratricopeptide (TPR) repeat protein
LRRYREYVWLRQIEAVKQYAPEKLALLQKAQAVEPMNPDTVYNLGENLRGLSWQGNADYQNLAKQAMKWFELGMRLNPYDPYNPMRYGMCLHWIGRHQEAGPYFAKALKLDPNNYYVVAHEGWHRVQLGDYAGAKSWFEKSLKIKPVNNPIAQSYLGIVRQKISEQK